VARSRSTSRRAIRAKSRFFFDGDIAAYQPRSSRSVLTPFSTGRRYTRFRSVRALAISCLSVSGSRDRLQPDHSSRASRDGGRGRLRTSRPTRSPRSIQRWARPGSVRPIAGGAVAYIDFGLQANGELVLHEDLVAGPAPSVSPTTPIPTRTRSSRQMGPWWSGRTATRPSVIATSSRP